MPHLAARCRVRRGGFVLDVDLDLRFDAPAAIYGESGSGKTTLLRAIAGLERAARGRIAVDGVVWQDDDRGVFRPPHRRGVGFVFQDARLFPHLSVESNLRYGFSRTPAAERSLGLDEVVQVLELGSLLARRPGGLSAGERQRVAIGRALLASPRLLLLDEPLASVDLARRREILPFLLRVSTELRIAFVYVSHSLDEVVRLASTMVLLADGRARGAGPTAEIVRRFDLERLTSLDP